MSAAAETEPAVAPDHRSGRPRVLLVLAVAAAASLALYAKWLRRPTLFMDDFQIVVRSWTWQRTWHDLWVPANEHAMPAGRLTTWLLVCLAGRQTMVPVLAGLQGPLALLAAVPLLYLFVRRELGHPLFGLVAAALFGVSTVYEQAVSWWSSSFSILTLDTLLLALLAAQQWRQSRHVVWLALCAGAAALAPTWFASGVLAGPLCSLYLLPTERAIDWRALLRSCPVALVPLLGTALFLAISLPLTASTINHLPHYQGQTALESFHPLAGMKLTLWATVECLLLGALGIGAVKVPFWVVCLVWPPLLAGGAWWWWGAPAGRRLVLLGAGFIVAGYLLVYSARADWIDESNMNSPTWSRYHLLPQLGLALFVAGGLARRARGRPAELSWAQALAALALVAFLFVTQMPRVVWTDQGDDYAAQQAVLRRIEAVDARCREHHIARATAMEALMTPGQKFDVPGGGEREDGWELLWGSPDPDPSITPEQARRLLAADGE